MPATNDLCSLGAAELVRTIRSREVTSVAVVQAHLDRIAALNPTVNAVTVVLAEQALLAANEADAALERGEVTGALHGVPFTVKENIDVAGSATTHGTVANAGAIAERDAPPVERLRAAGAIVLARTNMPDLGMRWHTANALRGETLNPWDASRTAGGSSGGEAVALATEMTPLGLGNDYGGSLRVPSQFCGTAALRPSYGRLAASTATAPMPTGQLFSVTGPMARSIEDLDLALGSLWGDAWRTDARDPRRVPAPLTGPTPSTPLRVAVVTDPGSAGIDPAVARGVRMAADALSDAGYAVEEREPPRILDCADTWATLADAELNSGLAEAQLAQCTPEARRFIEYTTGTSPAPTLQAYLQALATRHTHAREWAAFFEEYPIVLGPVCTEQPWAIGHDIAGPVEAMSVRRSMRFTVIANLLGLPAVSLPVGMEGHLPLGVQVMAERYREDLCLAAGRVIEERTGILTPIDPR
jgi:amidase